MRPRSPENSFRGSFALETSSNILIRPAVLEDIPSILGLAEEFVIRQILLPRSAEELRENYRNFLVACDFSGAVIGMGALRPFGDGLFEVRSLAVSPEHQGGGIGGKIVQALLERARAMTPPASCVFTLTKRPHFFEMLGFVPRPKEAFPVKIWADCRICPKRECCDETALEFRLDS